jgi:hypothetical protein
MGTTNKLAGQTLAAEEVMQMGSLGVAFTPTLEASTSNPNLGTSPTKTGFWWQQNELVHLVFSIVFGSSPSAGSGTYFVILPVPILDVGVTPLSVGGGGITDASGADDRLIRFYWQSGDDADRIRFNGEAYTGAASNSSPWTWAQTDQIWGSMTYPGDF